MKVNVVSQSKPRFQNIAGAKKACNHAVVPFVGLKTAMEKQVYASPESLQALYGIYKQNDGIVGTLPKEMITALKNAGVKPYEMSEKIKDLTGGISEAVKILREAEMIGAQTEIPLSSSQLASKFDSFESKADFNAMQNFADSLYGMGLVPKDKMRAIEERAGNTLASALKEVGILPQGGQVNIGRLGSGVFANAFRISFRDAEDKKVFHDKVLKIYKDPEAEEIGMRKVALKSIEYYSSMGEEEFINTQQSVLITLLRAIGSADDNALEEMSESQREVWGEIYRQKISMSVDDYVDIQKEKLKNLGLVHGIFPEANRAMFLKHAVGNMTPTNYVEHHFYDLKNRYAFVEMSDDELPAPEITINLEEYGLAHKDMKPDNIVKGRIVDVGGIVKK